MALEGVISEAPAPTPSPPEPEFELLESKLRPPRVRDGTVSRKTLISALEERSGSMPIVFLSAGPGWGKTTLLAEWASRSRRPFAWVSVDEKDNDPILLLAYIAAALNRLSPLDPAVFHALATPGASVEAKVVPRLGTALASIDQAVVLVLDDLHVLRDQQCLDALAALARHVPAGSQLALSARGGPALAPAGLRARGLAIEIGPDDLRLDSEQAGRLLDGAGVDLPAADLAELTDHVEGWPAGLYLAALSIRARGVGATGKAPFVGSDRLVVDYLRSELLAHLSPDEARFLSHTAVLERMSGALCDAVLESSGSAAILESLERSNHFLVPLDRAREWYRYHHLFQELLRAELDHAEPELVPRLLARAGEWCAANGQLEAAFGYAQEAGDVDRAAKLFEMCGPLVYQSGRIATTERWLGWLEAHGAMERNAAVAALGAAVASTWGRPAEALRLAEIFERASYDGSLPDGSASVDSWRALVRAQLCRQGVAQMRADAEYSVRELASGSFNRPNAALQLAFAHWLAGEDDEADDLFADVAEEGLAMGTLEAAAVAFGERAVIASGRGAWVQTEESVERALRIIRQSRMEEYPSTAIVCVLAARVALHQGAAGRAQEFLARAQRLRTRLTYALPYFAVHARLELARAYLTVADTGGAWTMLREIESLLRRRPELGRLQTEVEDLRGSLKTMRGKAPGASTLTAAELHVLPYLATHLTLPEIADRLYLSRHTVKSHAIAIYRKLNVTSRSGSVERAHALGLL
jgi:LuxR family transcriptional regulator, maltose regulon positive regulatory protein